MSKLEKYLFKNVVVKDIRGNECRGYVDMYCSADENDDNEESIGIIPNKSAKEGIELSLSEIKSIKIAER